MNMVKITTLATRWKRRVSVQLFSIVVVLVLSVCDSERVRSKTKLKLRGKTSTSPKNPLDPQFFNMDSAVGSGLKTRQELAPSGEFIIDSNSEVGLNNAFDNPIRNAGFLNDYLTMTKKEIAAAKNANIDSKLGAAMYVNTGIKQKKPMGVSAEELGGLDTLQVAQMTSQHMNVEEWKSINEQLEDRPPMSHAPPGDPNWSSLNKPISPAAKRGFPDGTNTHGGALSDEGGMLPGGSSGHTGLPLAVVLDPQLRGGIVLHRAVQQTMIRTTPLLQGGCMHTSRTWLFAWPWFKCTF